jgi:hypothetical protein
MSNRITKRKFGVLGNNSYPHIPVAAAGFATKISIPGGSGGGADGGTDDIYIVKQKGARRFLVRHSEDGEQGVCKLVNKALAPDDSTQIVAGEMVVIGYLNGQAVTLRKINNRTCADFTGRRFKYTLSDDSSTTLMILTLIANQ